jgi:hypothetical protein
MTDEGQTSWLYEVLEDTPAELPHRDRFQSKLAGAAAADYVRVRTYLEHAKRVDPDDLPQATRDAIEKASASFRSTVLNLITKAEMADNDQSRISATTKRNADQAAATVQQSLGTWLETLRSHRPHLIASEFDWTARYETVRAMEAEYDSTLAKVNALHDRLERLGIQVGVGPVQTVYRDHAHAHQVSARQWLWAVVGSVVLTILVGVALLIFMPPPETTAAAVGVTATKVVILGSLAFGVSMVVRTYRSHAHLEAVYELRAGALATFTDLHEALQDDSEARAIVLTELAKAVFAPADTGMTSTSGDKTIVENVMPLMSPLGRSS